MQKQNQVRSCDAAAAHSLLAIAAEVATPPPPTLLFVDFLQNKTGVRFYHQLKAQSPSTRIIIIT